MSKRDYDHLFKIVLVGDSGVGKSSVLMRYTDNSFSESYISTIGVDFRFKTINLNGENIKLQIWDTAGQERFRSITSSFYRGADAIIMVYDITDKQSFTNIDYWLMEAKKHTNDRNLPIIIIGNKSERTDRCVQFVELKKIATDHDTLFTECSARTGDNIDKLFIQMADILVKNKGLPPIKNIIIPTKDEPKKTKCC